MKKILTTLLGISAALFLHAAAPAEPESVLLFANNSEGSKFYRIPAIATTTDGTIVVAADKRLDNMGDLPNRIDVVAKRSRDNGRTWSETITIARHQGDCGFGDPALVLDRQSGDLLCIFASGEGLFTSTPEKRIEINVSRSADQGMTWSSPARITPYIYGSECADSLSKKWYGVFAASGHAHCMRDGTLAFVIAVRKTAAPAPPLANYVCLSNDGGHTWRVLPAEVDADGDESKLVELADGSWLMSIRNRHKGHRKYAVSSDRGATWTEPHLWDDLHEPACNGDLLRYTVQADGFSRNRLLHSIPFDPAERQNVSVLMSYDEGRTWPVRKPIWEGPSGYSALTVLADGSIGIATEVGDWSGFDIWFTRITPEWLTDGADSYK